VGNWMWAALGELELASANETGVWWKVL